MTTSISWSEQASLFRVLFLQPCLNSSSDKVAQSLTNLRGLSVKEAGTTDNSCFNRHVAEETVCTSYREIDVKSRLDFNPGKPRPSNIGHKNQILV